jgi:hypothetical protein
MGLNNTRKGFLDTKEGKEIKSHFQRMIDDNSYSTASSYTANSILYPDNLIPFVDKHMDYLISHPLLEASKYLANIKLITRLRE